LPAGGTFATIRGLALAASAPKVALAFEKWHNSNSGCSPASLSIVPRATRPYGFLIYGQP
jgi:hypothetical protein